MITLEKLRRYFWYFFSMMGVVFLWAGIWDGIGYLPYLKNPWFSLTLGVFMAVIMARFYKRTIPLLMEEKEAVQSVLHTVHKHPQRHLFHIKYKDEIKKAEIMLRADKIKTIEKNFLVFAEKGKSEIFVPFHRVTEVLHKGERYWRG